MKSFGSLGVVLLSLACAKNPGGPKDPRCVRVDSGHGPAGSTPIVVETVVSGLEVPWSLSFLPEGDWLVTERPGRLRIVRNGELLPAIAEVPVAREGEGGLLGAALHPSFADNRWFYIYFTAQKGDEERNRVERWRLAPDASRAERDKLVLDDIPAAKYHDGGRLRFGPDGKLYVGTGDAREPNLAQKKSSLAGKILRLEPDGTIPSDNPFPGSPVFALGIRNTQGFDWIDERTLVVVDHGPSGELGRKGNDEVSIVTAGANLGWPTIWGCQAGAPMSSPVLSWADATPPGGAALYRGRAIPEWKDNLLIGTLESKHLHRVVFGADRRTVVRHERYLQGAKGYGRLRDVVMGPDGHLYVTTSNCDGRGDCGASKDRILRIRR